MFPGQQCKGDPEILNSRSARQGNFTNRWSPKRIVSLTSYSLCQPSWPTDIPFRAFTRGWRLRGYALKWLLLLGWHPNINMISYLEVVPNDVLRHIAFHCAFSSTFEPPHNFLNLLLTNRRIYNSLSISTCPEVYARLFCSKFDTTALLRRFPSLTTSCFASELVQRCRALRRIRRCCISEPDIQADLWTLYLMILESDGLNEMQLLSAGVFQFLVLFIRNRFGNGVSRNPTLFQTSIADSLALWLLWFTISRRESSSDF